MSEETADMPAQLLTLRVVRDRIATYRQDRWMVTDPESLSEVFEDVFDLSERAEETLCMITLDTRHRPVGFWEVACGSINESVVHPRELFKRALLTNAHGIVTAHNHPSGVPKFSPEDRQIAGRLARAGEMLGVELVDFIVVGSGGRIKSARHMGLTEVSSPA